MSFSKRMGLEPMEVPIQLKGMTEELRNSLWNQLIIDGFDYAFVTDDGIDEPPKIHNQLQRDFFKKRLDDMENSISANHQIIRDWYNDTTWNNVYDFIEFVLSRGVLLDIESINQILEIENSGYRLLGKQFIPVVSEVEIESIEAALKLTDKYAGVRTHIETALVHMSNKTKPDFRNSIKESISAVEAVVKIITQMERSTLSGAMPKLRKKVEIDSSIEAGFKELYNWTNRSGGIRHSLMEAPNLKLSDARYMLVACSAFTNYLIEKYEAE